MDKLKSLITEEDTWSAAEGEMEDTPFFLRYRPHLQEFINTKRYNQRLILLWSYSSEDDYLLPTPEEFDLMAEVEAKLVETFEADAQTVLAFVFTGQNRREWHWYTSDSEAAENKLTTSLAEYENLPIDLSIVDDEDWEEYLGLVEEMEDSENDENASEEDDA